MKSRMSIRRELALTFSGVMILGLIFSWVSLRTIGNLGSALSEAVNSTSTKLDLVGAMRARFQEMIAANCGVELALINGDPAGAQKQKQKQDAALVRIGQQLNELGNVMTDATGTTFLRSIEQQLTRLDSISARYRELGRQQKHVEAHRLMQEELRPLIQQMEEAAAVVTRQNRELVAEAARAGESSVSRSRWITFTLISLSFVAAVAAAFSIRRINRSLRRIADELLQGATQTASAAGQVAAASQSLAQGASEQAASLEETSAASEQVNSMALKNAESSHRAVELGSQSQREFQEAGNYLDEAVSAMGEISSQSGRISNILRTIDEIAFQTNILALNAAVEAARAGEAGMGFAVVADEVRNLAQRCAAASQDTAGMIEESISKSRVGQDKVDRVAAAIRSLRGESATIHSLLDGVSQASEEQSQGILNISKSMRQMEQTTQSVAANAEESAAASEQLNAQSETMKKLVGHLNALVGS